MGRRKIPHPSAQNRSLRTQIIGHCVPRYLAFNDQLRCLKLALLCIFHLFMIYPRSTKASIQMFSKPGTGHTDNAQVSLIHPQVVTKSTLAYRSVVSPPLSLHTKASKYALRCRKQSPVFDLL